MHNWNSVLKRQRHFHFLTLTLPQWPPLSLLDVAVLAKETYPLGPWCVDVSDAPLSSGVSRLSPAWLIPEESTKEILYDWGCTVSVVGYSGLHILWLPSNKAAASQAPVDKPAHLPCPMNVIDSVAEQTIYSTRTPSYTNNPPSAKSTKQECAKSSCQEYQEYSLVVTCYPSIKPHSSLSHAHNSLCL